MGAGEDIDSGSVELAGDDSVGGRRSLKGAIESSTLSKRSLRALVDGRFWERGGGDGAGTHDELEGLGLVTTTPGFLGA
mgnify:CR=1 FL=1